MVLWESSQVFTACGVLFPMPSDSFCHAYHTLTTERQRLDDLLARDRAWRARLFAHAVQTPALRVALARRIQALDQQIALGQRVLDLNRRQRELLSVLLYAQETGAPLPSASFDWRDLLTPVSRAQDGLAALRARLDAILAWPGVAAPAAAWPAEEHDLLVASVPDGDGLKLADGRRVRYIGLDAPEMGGFGQAAEPYAAAAKTFNAQLVLHQRVRLLRDASDTDRHGRLLRYVYAGKLFVNAEIVAAGWATTLTVWPDERHAAEFEHLEQTARRARRGIWGNN